MNACNHENVKSYYLQKTKYDLNSRQNIDIPNVFLHREICQDCGEIREEIDVKKETNYIHKNQNLYSRHQYKVSQTYFTDAGNLVERSWNGDWYWNGQKMTWQQLEVRMKQTGDRFGNQDVSDNYKEICYAAKNKSLEIRYGKDDSFAKLRDRWN